MLADLAGGAIGAYEGNGADVPATWFESDVELDPATGSIYAARDHRVPIAGQVAGFPPGSVPPEVTALAERLAAKGKPPARVQPSRRVIRSSYKSSFRVTLAG